MDAINSNGLDYTLESSMNNISCIRHPVSTSTSGERTGFQDNGKPGRMFNCTFESRRPVVKVLHLINTVSAGGAELHLLTLCRYLKRFGIDVIVAYLKRGKGSRFLHPDFEAGGIKVVSLNGERAWDVRYLLRTIKLIKSDHPDLIHTHLPRADLVGRFLKQLFPSFPWVCSIHDIYVTHWSGWWSLPLFRHVWRSADHVIAISEAVKGWLVERNGVTAEKVDVVYYGIELERFEKPLKDLRSFWGLNDGPVIGTIGRLEFRKGHDILIRAMPTVLSQVPNAILLIAGHDPWGYSQRLKQLIDSLGLSERVRLVGFQDDVASFLHALDIFAFASRTEGFGQVVIEAMAVGKPVVVPQIAPLTEIVLDRETGFCVQPESPAAFADAIFWLLSNPGEAKRMGQNGAERVRRFFSAERMVQQTLELYKQLLITRKA